MKTLGPLLVAALMLAGCTSPFSGEFGRKDPEPFEVTGLKVAQFRVSGPPPGLYMGSIEFPVCRHNQNDFNILQRDGFEVYQHTNPNGSEWRIVKQYDSGSRVSMANGRTVSALGMAHDVVYNETIEGGSTNYTIHIWHEIINSGNPIHRWDRWFNVTFVPYTTQTFYEEGQECNR